MPEDAGEGQVKPLATAEQLVAILVPDVNKQVKSGIDTIRQSILAMAPAAAQMGLGAPDTDSLDKFLDLTTEILMADDVQKELAASILKSVKQAHSPEQIDTLVNFYTENPWALECQSKMVASHGRNMIALNQKIMQRLTARLPELFGIDLPNPWSIEDGDGT